MNILLNLQRLIAGTAMLLSPAHVLAQVPTPDGVLNQVGAPLDGTIGGAEIGGIFEFIADSAIPLFYIFGFLVIVRAGFILITEQDDEQAARSRRAILGTITVLVLVNLVEPIRDALLGIPEEEPTIQIVEEELMGLILWFEMFVGIAAVTVIIISGIRAVITWGGEEGLQQLRKTVFAVLAGIILIVFKYALCGSVAVSGNPQTGSCGMGFAGVIAGGGIIGTILTVFNIILGFTALVAVAVLVYAGFLMVANIGNDDQYGKAKSLAGRVALGLLVIIVSGALINIVAGIIFETGGFFFGGGSSFF